MAAADFEHRIEIAVDRASLRDFLCDLDRYRELHPLIESIDELPADPASPGARRYRVVDQLKLGPLRWRSAYTAAIEAMSDALVRGDAWQGRGLHVVTRYQLEDIPEGTRVVEQVTIEAPWYLRAYVRKQARDAHRTTLERMQTLLEA